MPYINVHVDICDIIDELSDKDLREEMSKRAKRKGTVLEEIDKREKSFRLRDAALELRKIDKIANAVWLEDIASQIDEE